MVNQCPVIAETDETLFESILYSYPAGSGDAGNIGLSKFSIHSSFQCLGVYLSAIDLKASYNELAFDSLDHLD